ncbi:hypothetical protein GGI04_005074 [Coemansia thaxteri]|uniref:Uncharacterized protein n=1 Tax=Coemansia thaxteri TaxID=2663907 RepID=A0A9W8BGW2_9FUNG|nr:hypothetical protein GGI04_005074 [Coemansia thaxteri]KAJ2006653.1 hypothetical protein H4R26_001249 [Coemansia thaxteri]KAJ2470685.1 hypothetical protein GGI02_002767 [Coemansia sp. RSA 2322]KAJ2484935.1 hypothetical protein EV174_002073 [Coemansia sp. RSA 2320]
MAYARPLGQTFNQLNLHMYRLPDSQRGALRSTSLALAREASREDSHRSGGGSDSGGSHYNPFKGIKRLYTGLRKHHRTRGHSPPDDETKLRKFYSTPLRSSDVVSGSPPPAPSVHPSKTAQTASRPISDSEIGSIMIAREEEQPPSPSKSPSRASKHVRFAGSEPKVIDTYSPEEYDRRVVDPWELLTKESRVKLRDEMNEYMSNEMKLNDVYYSNDSTYCTLCWRPLCHCRALSKDIWRRARSSNMVRAGA